MRLCDDSRELNKKTIQDRHPISRIKKRCIISEATRSLALWTKAKRTIKASSAWKASH